jgi:hypothetical protein
MESQRILIGSMLATLAASFAAAYYGHALIGFLLFVFALTPLPFHAAQWLRRRLPGVAARCDGGPGFAARRAIDTESKRRPDERTRT